MTAIPEAVLSEQFQARLNGRKLVALAFATFQFDPHFFEAEILPVFLGMQSSHSTSFRLAQLDEELHRLHDRVAVYYDRDGLVSGGEPVRLDLQRVPIRHPTGIFHTKLVLALVEDKEGLRALLCGCLSANLTRSGWWENVEACHVEELVETESTMLKDPLRDYVKRIIAAAPRQDHGALRTIDAFLKKLTQGTHRSVKGRLRPHFHCGRESLTDFLVSAAGDALSGMCLEIVSPYFDRTGTSPPMREILERFQPRETRVYLPKNHAGDGNCTESLFSWMSAQPGVEWGALPEAMLRMGKAKEVRLRGVHAKVYRFFEPRNGGRELLYVGSTNLTLPGCRVSGKGGNWESGVLVEVTATGRPGWWLTNGVKRPAAFDARLEDEGSASLGGSNLSLRYDWNDKSLWASWHGNADSPALSVRHGGIERFAVGPLPVGEEMRLDAHSAVRIQEALLVTSLLEVHGEGPEPRLLLVQEEGMSERPSLFRELKVSEILEAWSLLTPEQRAAFLEIHGLPPSSSGEAPRTLDPDAPTVFDRFAGIIHAFSCLEARVRDALEADRGREVEYRLFGRRYDSLRSLLDRMLAERAAGGADLIAHHVQALCARQLLQELERDFKEYWRAHANQVLDLEQVVAQASEVRDELAASDPEMPTFLDWFDEWFLERAAPLPEEAHT